MVDSLQKLDLRLARLDDKIQFERLTTFGTAKSAETDNVVKTVFSLLICWIHT